MKILRDCKRYMSYSGLDIRKTINIGGVQFSRTFIRTLIFSIQFLLDFIELINFINNYGHGLKAILFPLHCVILYTMKLAIYIVLLTKTNQIAELMDYLEMIVNKRMVYFNHILYDFCLELT